MFCFLNAYFKANSYMFGDSMFHNLSNIKHGLDKGKNI